MPQQDSLIEKAKELLGWNVERGDGMGVEGTKEDTVSATQVLLELANVTTGEVSAANDTQLAVMMNDGAIINNVTELEYNQPSVNDTAAIPPSSGSGVSDCRFKPSN